MLETVHPPAEDLVAHVEACTEGDGADAVFKVSGSQAEAEVIAEHLPLDALPDAFARLATGTDAVKISIDTQGGRMYD